MSAERTTGRLLISTPELDDGAFHRSVILVLHHEDDGAQGVVLNKPLGADAEVVLPGWGRHLSSPATLFHGGPVQPDGALGLVRTRHTAQVPAGGRHLFGSVAVIDLDAEPDEVMADAVGLRIFAGYAGWGAGQLEAEIAHGSWFLVDAGREDLLTDQPETLWAQVLRRQEDALAFVAFFPADPSQN